MPEYDQDYVKRVIEAVLFVCDKPVPVMELRDVLPMVEPVALRQAVVQLQREYEEDNRGMHILEIAEGFQMLSNPRYAEAIRIFFKTRVKDRLSKPALETLAIVAYRQPVSRADVESIRGVNSDGVVSHLLQRGLVRITGRKDIPGRPYLYGTTREFLEYFGLKSLRDLPRLEEFPALFRERGGEESAGNAAAGSDADQPAEDVAGDAGAATETAATVSADRAQLTADTEEAAEAESADKSSETAPPQAQENCADDEAEESALQENAVDALQQEATPPSLQNMIARMTEEEELFRRRQLRRFAEGEAGEDQDDVPVVAQKRELSASEKAADEPASSAETPAPPDGQDDNLGDKEERS